MANTNTIQQQLTFAEWTSGSCLSMKAPCHQYLIAVCEHTQYAHCVVHPSSQCAYCFCAPALCTFRVHCMYLCPTAAPLFLTGVQFAFQNLLAKCVFATGVVQRVGERMTWREWGKLGEAN
jgi:hypothetical protein